MSLIRVLLCILLPPLAVLDKGCGSILLVAILTLLGWIPGAIASLIISMGSSNQTETAAAGMYSVPKLSMKKWSRLIAVVPAAGPYESAATDAQRDRLWRMGLSDQAFLDSVGKSQSSWLIDAGMGASKKSGGMLGAVILVIIIVSVGASLIVPNVKSVSQASTSKVVVPTPAIAGAPMAAPTATPDPFVVGAKAKLKADRVLTLPHGIVRLNSGSQVTIKAVAGDTITVDSMGETLAIPRAELVP